jgi:23S rRNA (adenine2030-N6)-methyltransferase
VANVHFGDIGDVWKHLAFAEIVATEQPQHVWECHAGSALYPLSHSPDRDFGVYFFREHASTSATLRGSTYARILRELETGGDLQVYPGSPFLAMQLLKRGSADFVFCDTDASSLADIKDAASRLSIDNARLRLIHGDGLSTVSQLGAELPTAEAASTVVHIDPYQPWRASSGLNSFDLLCQLADRGIMGMLWTGYHTRSQRDKLFQALQRATAKAGTSAERLALWCGDARLAGKTGGRLSADAGVISSLIIGSHLSARTRDACDELGHELARIYGSARLPDGHDAAMEYTSF